MRPLSRALLPSLPRSAVSTSTSRSPLSLAVALALTNSLQPSLPLSPAPPHARAIPPSGPGPARPYRVSRRCRRRGRTPSTPHPLLSLSFLIPFSCLLARHSLLGRLSFLLQRPSFLLERHSFLLWGRLCLGVFRLSFGVFAFLLCHFCFISDTRAALSLSLAPHDHGTGCAQ